MWRPRSRHHEAGCARARVFLAAKTKGGRHGTCVCPALRRQEEDDMLAAEAARHGRLATDQTRLEQELAMEDALDERARREAEAICGPETAASVNARNVAELKQHLPELYQQLPKDIQALANNVSADGEKAKRKARGRGSRGRGRCRRRRGEEEDGRAPLLLLLAALR